MCVYLCMCKPLVAESVLSVGYDGVQTCVASLIHVSTCKYGCSCKCWCRTCVPLIMCLTCSLLTNLLMPACFQEVGGSMAGGLCEQPPVGVLGTLVGRQAHSPLLTPRALPWLLCSLRSGALGKLF